MTQPHSPSTAPVLRDVDLPSCSKRAGVRADIGADIRADLQLSSAAIRDLIKAREGRWQPGLSDQPLHSEIFASAKDASGAGLALALARDALQVQAQAQADAAERGENPLAEVEDRRQVLWVQDARAMQISGRLYLHGLPPELRERVIHVAADKPEDALFALEEGLKCRDLVCVIGEIAGNPRSLDFTASRRLSLAAQKHGIALWLVRIEAQRDLSSARMRWEARPAPSAPPRWNAQAPGASAWQAELFRAARYAPGKWTLTDDKGQLTRQLTRKRSRSTLPPRSASTQEADIRGTNTPYATPPHRAADIGDMVRPTVGRSLAAFARR